MANAAALFLSGLIVIAVVGELVANSKGTSSAINATSGLLSNSIKAAKS